MDDITKAKDYGFHKYVFGHWHMPFDHPLYSCCGSVSGTTAYDHRAGRYAKPSQSSWLVHQKHGEYYNSQIGHDPLKDLHKFHMLWCYTLKIVGRHCHGWCQE